MTNEQRAREVSHTVFDCLDDEDHCLDCDHLTVAILTLMQQARREEREKFATADCHVGDFIDDLDQPTEGMGR